MKTVEAELTYGLLTVRLDARELEDIRDEVNSRIESMKSRDSERNALIREGIEKIVEVLRTIADQIGGDPEDEGGAP